MTETQRTEMAKQQNRQVSGQVYEAFDKCDKLRNRVRGDELSIYLPSKKNDSDKCVSLLMC